VAPIDPATAMTPSRGRTSLVWAAPPRLPHRDSRPVRKFVHATLRPRDRPHHRPDRRRADHGDLATPAFDTDIPMPSTSLNCSHCKQPMTAVALEGHYGQRIEIDSCGHCQLLWIDDFESVRLSGLGWIALLRHIHAESTSAAHTAATARAHGLQLPLSCMRCANSLTPVRNLTRFGRTAAH
jgi:hypothetical protein